MKDRRPPAVPPVTSREPTLQGGLRGATALREMPGVEYRPDHPLSFETNLPPAGPIVRFIALDAAIILCVQVAAVYGALVLWKGQPFIRETQVWPFFLLALPIMALRIYIHASVGLYDFIRNHSAVDILGLGLKAVFWGSIFEILALLMINTYYLPDLEIPRSVLALELLILTSGICGWRLAYQSRRKFWGYDHRRVLIVGAGEVAKDLSEDIHTYAQLGHKVIGYVNDDTEQQALDVPFLGRVEDIPALVEAQEVTEIIIAVHDANRSQLLEAIALCEATGARVRLLPDLFEIMIGQVDISQVAGIPLIEVRGRHLPHFLGWPKRVFDLVVVVPILTMLAPLLVLIAVVVKVTSEGPVLYRQERIGRAGKKFQLLKFRTMIPRAEDQTGPLLCSKNDDRVTVFGRWLRKLHLDELPQFVNVFKGEMSLVGPRPERPLFVEQFARQIPFYPLRHDVRPGVTGLAQIHGHYHSAPAHKLRYDLAYLHAASLLLDLKILFLTLRLVLTGKRAE